MTLLRGEDWCPPVLLRNKRHLNNQSDFDAKNLNTYCSCPTRYAPVPASHFHTASRQCQLPAFEGRQTVPGHSPDGAGAEDIGAIHGALVGSIAEAYQTVPMFV
jgi:hypothetical protein